MSMGSMRDGSASPIAAHDLPHEGTRKRDKMSKKGKKALQKMADLPAHLLQFQKQMEADQAKWGPLYERVQDEFTSLCSSVKKRERAFKRNIAKQKLEIARLSIELTKSDRQAQKAQLEEFSSCFMRKLWCLEMVSFIKVLEGILSQFCGL